MHNNVIGTRNIAVAAASAGVHRFVNISTDKAVNPSTIMGLSKKLTELSIQEISRSFPGQFSSVRFGNVAGSTGSVIRLFWDQIQKGGPLRITDSRATRYFIAIPEAVYLIIRAAQLGRGGETFVFDMGKPISILELAKTLCLLSGLKPYVDIPIEFVGIQEGEKINEELWEDWEKPGRTSTEEILVITEQDPRSFGILKAIEKLEGYIDGNDVTELVERARLLCRDVRRTRGDHVPDAHRQCLVARSET
jgi:FlaA1/EpsC-like NDP-sugar epimerase